MVKRPPPVPTTMVIAVLQEKDSGLGLGRTGEEERTGKMQ